MKMPKNKDEFERKMLHAFSCGMSAGYGVDHENIHDDEEEAIREFAKRNGFKRTSLTN